MRTLGCLMTALGCAGLVGALAPMVVVALGLHDRLGMSLILTVVSSTLMFIGGRLRARGIPLLPILLSP